MNDRLIWLWLSVKRQLKRPLFVVFLLAVPAVMVFLSRLEQADSGRIAVAVYAEDETLAPEVIGLLESAEGVFEFYTVPSAEAVKEDVAARRAECGYIFGEDLKGKLDSGNYRRCITVISAPSTVLAELSTEVVYARLIEVYGRELLKTYSEEGEGLSFLPEEERWEALEPLYEKYASNGSTFSFEYVTAEEAFGEDAPGVAGALQGTDSAAWEDAAERAENAGGLAGLPVRGVGAVCMFIMGLFSAAWLVKDEESGLFAAVSGNWRSFCRAVSAGAPVFLLGLSVLAAVFFSGGGGNLLKEAALMAVYAVLVAAFSMALERLLGRAEILLGLLPFLAIASLVVCPVFADLSYFVPAFRLLRLLFVPYYYLWGCAAFL